MLAKFFVYLFVEIYSDNAVVVYSSLPHSKIDGTSLLPFSQKMEICLVTDGLAIIVYMVAEAEDSILIYI